MSAGAHLPPVVAAPPAASGRVVALSEQKRALLERRLSRTAAPATIGPRPADAPLVLSSAQERLWFMEQFAPGTAAYVVPLALRLPVAPPPDRVARALRELAARHEVLRMSFPATTDGRPAVALAGLVDIPLAVLEVADEEEAREIVAAEAAKPFDLTRPPLLRAALLRLPTGAAVLQVTAHHIVFDGWSADLVIRHLQAALATETSSDGPPALGYGDYAHWQRGQLDTPAARRDLAYWRTNLAGVSPLDLPVDRPHPAEPTYDGADHSFHLPAELTDRLRRLGSEHRATLYMTLLAAWQVLLGRYAAQDDLTVGSPVAGRSRGEFEGVVGPFVNMLTLRADLSDEPTFHTLLGRTRDTVLDALTHQELPFEHIVQELAVTRDVRRAPLFQVTFALQNYGSSTTAPQTFPVDLRATRFELSLYVTERPDGLGAVLVYRRDLFAAATVARLARHLESLLRALVARPDVPVTAVDLMEDGEAARVLALGDGGPVRNALPALDAAGTLADLVKAAAAATPRAKAVVCGRDSLTYRELDRAANRLAHHLRALGVGPDVPVAVCLQPSTRLAVALLAVLKAGGAYVPIDPEQPAARTAAVYAAADPAVVVTDVAARTGLPPTGPTVVCLDGDRFEVARRPSRPVASGTTPDHLAYVIFTSGSTGRPKGVAVAHRQVLTYLRGVAERLGIGPGERFALPQSLAFDFAVTMFYLALAAGGEVHLVPRRGSGAELARYLREHRVDHLKLTPSHLAALASDVDDPTELAPRRTLLLGGEPSMTDWAATFGRTGCRVVNHYGPTEATVGVSTYDVSSGTGPTPIGRPLPAARLYVLDKGMRPVPIGVPGEIYVGGDRLARGYVGLPAATARAFVPDPFGPPGARLYRTGDLGRWRADGDSENDGVLEFLGRRDEQVKVRGYRVELGEVAAALTRCPGVGQAVVLLRDDQLVGYLERASPGAEALPASRLRRMLLETLPEYMVPGRFVWLDRLPLQRHGKVDRRALPDPGSVAAGSSDHTPPATDLERTIVSVWATVLSVGRIGVDDDFFDLGGHSLLATQVVARLRRAAPDLPRPISVLDMFRYHTVRELAAVASGGARVERLLHELTPRDDPAPRVMSIVCVPYGGASAVVYQPLADALPPGHRLYAVAVPGHDIGLADDSEPIDEVAARCVEEILSTVHGPLVLYGHCGPGSALTVEVARRLEAAGRTIDAVYLGGIFPFARPVGRLLGPLARLRPFERIRSDRVYANWLQSMGADVGALDEDQARFVVRTMRHDAQTALDYYTDLLHRQVTPLAAPVISVIGERDPGTDYYQERYREWHLLSGVTALVVLDEAGHYFLKYRADELAEILTGTHADLTTGAADRLGRAARGPDASWWLHEVSTRAPDPDAVAVPSAQVVTAPANGPDAGPRPSMGRFFAVAGGQTVSIIGSSFTDFAIPLWIYMQTGSVARFAVLAVLGLVPGMLIAPLAGVVVDRYDRRTVIMAADLAAGSGVLALGVVAMSGGLRIGLVYGLIAWLSMALMLQRLAYNAAIPQLVPKRNLGHANGFFQLTGGAMVFLVPLTAVGLLGTIGMGGILLVDGLSYVVAIAVLSFVRFPRTMGFRRRESLGREIAGGLRYSVGQRSFRGMLLYFMVLNIFLSPMLLLVSPLLLTFTDLHTVVRVAMACGVAGMAGGLTLTVWGGPRRRRMRGILLVSLFLAVAGAVTGAQGSAGIVGAGAVAMTFGMVLLNGIYATIIQTKVPQRLHGRVIALNTVAAWCTLPLGWAVVAPLGSRLFERLLADDGLLTGSVGALVGTGPGRGIGLLYMVLAALMTTFVAVAARTAVLRHFDDDVPDAEPDDLVGLRTLQARLPGTRSGRSTDDLEAETGASPQRESRGDEA